MTDIAVAPVTASSADVLRWRMRALGLMPGGGSPLGSSGATTQRLLALQGQDWHASLWALGVRNPGLSRTDVYAAFNAGELVRSWPMRGTIHLVHPSDLGWMQRLTEKRVLAGVPKRRAYLGLDDDTVHRVIDATGAALAGGRSLSRDALAESWRRAGIDAPGAWRYHLVWWMSQTGLVVQGPVAEPYALGRTPEPLLVLASEWIRSPRLLDSDEALTELVARYTMGRGVVQAKDLAWWAGLSMTEVKRGFIAAASAGAVVSVEVGGVQYWGDPTAIDSADTPTGTLLLPAFDEHLLGYTDRSAQLNAQHFERIVPGRNGMFRATVVRDGRVVGTWRSKHLTTKSTIEVEALPGERITAAELDASAADWATFHGDPAAAVTVS